jgi:hypothetical protein
MLSVTERRVGKGGPDVAISHGKNSALAHAVCRQIDSEDSVGKGGKT